MIKGNAKYTKYMLIASCILFLFFLHSQFRSEHVWLESIVVLPETESIKVVSYNIQYGKGQDGQVNLQRAIDTLKEINADIISLQEVERYSLRSGFEDQIQSIAKELGMNGVFFPSVAYPGMYYGNAILSRFPIKESFYHPLLSQHENRSVVLVDIQLPEEQTIYVLTICVRSLLPQRSRWEMNDAFSEHSRREGTGKTVV